jgi:DNA-binding MarR family transcriptional regulator
MSDPQKECFSLASRRLARVIGQVYDKALVASGLKITQFSVLTAVGQTQGQELPLGVIAKAIDMDKSTLTRALNPLVRDGFVTLSKGEDRRQRSVELTDAGQLLLAQATVSWSQAQLQIETLLGETFFAESHRTMTAMRRKISSKNDN